LLNNKLCLTAVWQNGGFSAKINGSSSIELLYKTVHLCFDFRHFAKLQTDVVKSLRAFTTSSAGFANVISPSGLHTFAGFAKGKTPRKASGRYHPL
jgi:hypothetical protein